ncbi:MAG TPA: MucB/RseB C-terminal domain-containing protein [Dokdonella sp.]|uniref:MucB/RseB C-terminal domain-containing protein n=1 Tax=Dokdonella sp. TaxID=2291710 RepID=UPI002D7FE01F|nr:MucB/RseB C-terminal domain-containing protein [Dokdonella sp.]HET9034324.1 MucB/RseB C-terminal domain-containing protein [Dokdonella sp.]
MSIALGAISSHIALAQTPEGATLLAQMAAAMRATDYQGSFVYQHAGRIDTLRVFHAGGARERERLISLNGPRNEIVRNGTNITSIRADDSAIVYNSTSGRGLLPLVPDSVDPELEKSYRIVLNGSDRVAGYSADIVDIVARDGFRYGYRLWIDKGSRLLLRSIVTDSKRQPLEQFMFVSLIIGTPPSDTDLVPRQRELLTTTATDSDEIELRGEPMWSVSKAPSGFAFRSARRSMDAVEGAQHLVYSDGLASVSVYVEPKNSTGDELTTIASRGTMNIYTYSNEKWRFTVLGDVPLATVTMMAQSLQPVVKSVP